jgi:3-phenylpropionate/trans-cinnamate dioxygenase ferredoxin reductase subunit
VLIGEEPVPPYERPPLSKGFLAGSAALETFLLRPDTFWAEHDVDLRLGVRATGIDTSARTVTLSDGPPVRADALVIATGGRSRVLDVPGVELEGVYGLRTLADATAIRERAAGASHAVVVGMGFIGAEAAATLRGLGLQVTVVEPLSAPLERVLGEQVGALIAQLHAEHDVQMIFGDGVVGFDGEGGQLREVATSSGQRLPADLVVVGVGMVPETTLLADTGVELRNGVVVDEFTRTRVPGVYAAGDVANHYHPLYGRHVRTEHWTHAIDHGAAVARSILGQNRPYDAVPWVWSDQYDLALQYAGLHTGWDAFVVRGDLAARDGIGFYLRDEVPVAAVAFNRGRDMRRALGVLRRARPVAASTLADEAVDLRTLAA